PWAVNDRQLNDVFSKIGTVVSVNVITDKFSGRSKGFGFVEMSTEEEAEKAIYEMNVTDLDGRKIIVNEERPFEERPRNNFQGGRRDNSRDGGRNRGGGRARSNRW